MSDVPNNREIARRLHNWAGMICDGSRVAKEMQDFARLLSPPPTLDDIHKLGLRITEEGEDSADYVARIRGRDTDPPPADRKP